MTPKNKITGMSQGGFTLLEVMVALVIGLILMLGLVSSFVGSTRAQQTLQNDSEQIENGRQAVDVLTQDVKMAGYFNSYYLTPTTNGQPVVPGSLPDPCDTTLAGLTTALALPLQVYNASSTSAKPSLSATGAGTACGGLLASSNLAPGSDVLVIRRADTTRLTAAADLQTDMVYLQTGAFFGDLRKGVALTAPRVWGYATANNLDVNSTSNPTLQIRDNSGNLVAGDIYRYFTRIYFVAPCSSGSGSLGACQSGDDSIPTLKMIELTATTAGTSSSCYTPSGAYTSFCLRPMVEGVLALALDSGIDNSPTTASPATGFMGDGIPDAYNRTSSTMSLLDMANTTNLNIFILAMNTKADPQFSDAKTYNLSDTSRTGSSYVVGPFTSTSSANANYTGNLHYRKHVYTGRVRVENISQKRENP